MDHDIGRTGRRQEPQHPPRNPFPAFARPLVLGVHLLSRLQGKLRRVQGDGEPSFAQLIRDKLIEIKPDGSFNLDLIYFDYCTDLRMCNEKFDALIGGPPRKPNEWLTQRHMDIAASIQAVTEEAVAALVDGVVTRFGTRDLCLAGGVALNCVANGNVLRSGKVDRLWIQPAAG